MKLILKSSSLVFQKENERAAAYRYLSALSSVTELQRTAFYEFYDTLKENGIYDKAIIVLPMLGATINDYMVDLMSPTEGNPLTNACKQSAVFQANASIDANGCLKAGTTNIETYAFGSISKKGNVPFTIVCFGKALGAQFFKSSVSIGSIQGGYITPMFAIGSTQIPSAQEQHSFGSKYIEAGSYDGETMKLHVNGALYKQASLVGDIPKIDSAYCRCFSHGFTKAMFWGYFEMLTDEEIAILTSSISKLNNDIGRA